MIELRRSPGVAGEMDLGLSSSRPPSSGGSSADTTCVSMSLSVDSSSSVRLTAGGLSRLGGGRALPMPHREPRVHGSGRGEFLGDARASRPAQLTTPRWGPSCPLGHGGCSFRPRRRPVCSLYRPVA
jgi:hypothetical protein